MAKGDNRRTQKMLRRKRQRKFKKRMQLKMSPLRLEQAKKGEKPAAKKTT